MTQPVGATDGCSGREYRFCIPVLPPSVNSLHNIIYGQRKVVLKPEILKWRMDVALFIPRITLLERESIIRADVVFYYRFHHQNGKLREFDTHNLVKPLLDVIAWKVGFSDKRIKKGSWDSVDSLSEKVEVTLCEIVALSQT